MRKKQKQSSGKRWGVQRWLRYGVLPCAVTYAVMAAANPTPAIFDYHPKSLLVPSTSLTKVASTPIPQTAVAASNPPVKTTPVQVTGHTPKPSIIGFQSYPNHAQPSAGQMSYAELMLEGSDIAFGDSYQVAMLPEETASDAGSYADLEPAAGDTQAPLRLPGYILTQAAPKAGETMPEPPPPIPEDLGLKVQTPAPATPPSPVIGLPDFPPTPPGPSAAAQAFARRYPWPALTAEQGLPANSASYTFEETIAHTLSWHPIVRANRERVKAAEAVVRQREAGYLPTLDLTAKIGPQYSYNRTTQANNKGEQSLTTSEGSVSLRQKLFDGLTTTNRIRAAEAELTAAQAALRDSENLVAFNAAQAFFDLKKNRDFIRIAEANYARHIQLHDAILVMADVTGRTADINQSNVRVALALSNLEQRRSALRQAEKNFYESTGLEPLALSEPPANPQLADENALGTLDEFMGIAAQSNPRLARARAIIESRSRDLDASRGSYSPEFDLELTGTRSINNGGVRARNDDGTALLVMRYNLYRGGGDLARERQAKWEMAAAKSELSNSERELSQRISESFYQLVAALRRAEALQVRAESASRVVEAYQEQFSSGRRSLLDLLDVQNELFQSELAASDVRYEVLIRYYDLQAQVGLLSPVSK